MAIQDDIKKAKQQQDIPVYVVSDSDVNEKVTYGNERVGLSGPGMYQFPGKNVYSPFAPGTKTSGGRQFEEQKRAQAIAEALAQKQYELDEKQVNYAINKPYYSPNSGGGGGFTPLQLYNISADQEEAVQEWTEKILALTEPKETEDVMGQPIEGANKFYYAGKDGKLNPFPEAALKQYKALIPANLYEDVAARVRGYYGYTAADILGGDSGSDVGGFRQKDEMSKNQAKNW